MDAFSKSKTPEGSRDLWETPPDVFDAIQSELGIRFSLDVCAVGENAKCFSYLSPDDDALSIDWNDRMGERYATIALWMNPPYSDPTPWVRKAAEESAKGLIVVGLVIHDPSTKWFQQYVEGVASVAYVPDRRISFLQDGKPVNGNPKPSIFPVWTPWRTRQTQYVRFNLPGKKTRAA